jgi:hypothetical protein
MMQSVAEHQVVSKEEVSVMLVGGLRKLCRDQNLAAGHHQKPKGRIQASCDSQKRLTIASRKMIHHARVAWHRKNVIRKDRTRKQVERGASTGQKDRKRLWRSLECKIGIKNPGTRQQLRRTREFSKTLKNTLGLEIRKRAVGISSRLQEYKDRTLWRCQPPPKQKKNLLALLTMLA